MPQSTLRTKWSDSFMYARRLRDAFTSVNSMMTELFADTVITIPIPAHASKTIYNVLIARRAYTVTDVSYVPDVAQGGALTATVVKATGTSAPAANTTPLHTGTVNLNGTAHTVQQLTLTGTAADLSLAAGNRIGVVLSGALTTGSGLLVIRLTKA